MSAHRRLRKELSDIMENGIKCLKQVKVDDVNILKWEGLIVPDKPPYNKGAFKIEITFPSSYPFKPPNVTFKTKIYHPNVDEKGQICLPIVSSDNWKPSLKADIIIKAVIDLIEKPEPEHPLRVFIAEEYLNDRKQFIKNAEEFTKKHSEKRPKN